MRSEYAEPKALENVLCLLTYSNALACKVAVQTGLRIGDVLSLKTAQIKSNRFTITEQKTKNKKRVYLPEKLRAELFSQAGRIWVFESRANADKHRTRQAVWVDIKRACRALRLPNNITPHSMRKYYAVKLYQKSGDIKKVREALGHQNETVTMLYAMADVLNSRKNKNCPKL